MLANVLAYDGKIGRGEKHKEQDGSIVDLEKDYVRLFLRSRSVEV